MAALPYMQLYCSDYLADTMHLNTEEHGAYLLLLMNYWQTGKPIPKNRLQAIARVHDNDRWTTVERALNEYFITEGDSWVHERMERDLKIAHDAQRQRIKAGKASAEARKSAKVRKMKDSAKTANTGGANDRSTLAQRSLNARSTDAEQALSERGNDRSTNKEQNRTEQNRTDSSNELSKPLSPPAEPTVVFEHWRKVMGKNKSTLFTADRKRKVQARLKEGYTVEQLCLAVTGCARTPHNMGQNDREELYNDLELICRTGSQVDRFMQNAQRESKQEREQRELDAWLNDQPPQQSNVIQGEFEHEPF